MVSEKSKANLEKGRQKGIKRKSTMTPLGTSWAELIRSYGETATPRDITAIAGLPDGTCWKKTVVAAAYRQAALGNAAILRELMARSEPMGVEATGVITMHVVYDDK
ncbi:MAG: hypothetical protein V1899_03135 [Planctomycetota bacterium]